MKIPKSVMQFSYFEYSNVSISVEYHWCNRNTIIHYVTRTEENEACEIVMTFKTVETLPEISTRVWARYIVTNAR